MTGGFSFPPPPPPPPRATSIAQPNGPVYENARDVRGGRGGRGRGGFRGRGGQQQRGGRQQQNDLCSTSQNVDDSDGRMNYHGTQQSFNDTAVLPRAYSIPAGAYVNPAFGNIHASSQSFYQYGQNQPYNTRQPQNSGVTPTDFPSPQKRNRDQAFGHGHKHPMKKPTSVPRTQAAPAVPSFGAPFLPSNPTVSAPLSRTTTRVTSVKKPLGLIPQDYDSEESEHEVDEEAAFANLESGPLSFEFNGELATLNSPADIASWIEERKKRWPSKQRIAEKKEEVQNRMEERRRIEHETRNAAARSSDAPESTLNRIETSKQKQRQQKSRLQAPKGQEASIHESRVQDAQAAPTLEEARRELDKQMQKVHELQRLLAESEARAAAGAYQAKDEISNKNQPLTKVERPSKDTSKEHDVTESLATVLEETQHRYSVNTAGLYPNHSRLEDQKESPQADNEPVHSAHDKGPIRGPAAAVRDSQNIDSGTSSDSSSSELETDSEEAPEEVTSKRDKPLRVPPPTSDQKVCSAFANTGRCKFGVKCRFRHVHDGRGPQSQIQREIGPSKRITLYQRMVEQEQGEENKLALQAIKHLGSVGFFSKG